MKTALQKMLGVTIATVIVLIAGAYGLAWLNLDRSGLARSIIWMDAGNDDHLRFPWRAVAAGNTVFTFEIGPGYPDGLPPIIVPGHPDIAAMLEGSETTAFIVVADGRLVYEQYFDGHDRHSIQASFSVAKSFNSALIGAAMSQGLIGSIDDPITDYIPELLLRDKRFGMITIRHLLSMSSGLRYAPAGMPWGDDAKTYYDPNLRRLALERSEIVEEPGQRFHYNNYNPLLIGIILERATGMAVSDYLSEILWKPIGAVADASWSLDSNASGFEKMESGINALPVDLAKLGMLYLDRGLWNGNQILPADWVDQSTRRSDATDPSNGYQYGWWTFDDDTLGDYYAAAGNKGQYMFVFPEDRLVVLRLGRSLGGVDWVRTIPAIAREMRSRAAGSDQNSDG